jgi:hypothetical protein
MGFEGVVENPQIFQPAVYRVELGDQPSQARWTIRQTVITHISVQMIVSNTTHECLQS